MSTHIPADQIRSEVRSAYSQALTSPGGGCCGTSCCGTDPAPATQKGVAARVAGYGAELEGLPADAVQNSFGCGNPVAFADVTPGETVVDLGSGAGIDVLLAGRLVGPTGRAIGVDMTDDMILRARQNIAESGMAWVEVRKGLIEDLPLRDGEADLVISNCVVNLSPEKHRVFGEIARVLKPGGRVSISDIVVQDLPDWARNSPALRSGCVAGAIDEASYIAGLQAAGLSDVEVTDRLVYDLDTVADFLDSEELGNLMDMDATTLRKVATELVGKVWSARFVARKPA